MPASLLPNGKQQFFTTPGVPAVGYKLATFASGTSSNQTTWADAGKVAANTNPIILDARGEAVIFWDGAYKVQLQDPTGAPIWTVDGVSTTQAPSANLIPSIDNTFTLGSPTFSWANAFLGANHVPVLDTVIGNIGYFKQTAAEAGVPIFLYSIPPLNVLRYGADPTGVNDSTAAIQAAINVAKVSGGVVFIPPGTYKTTATLSVGDVNTGVYIQGSGVATTTLMPTSAVTTSVLSFGTSGSSFQGFSDLTINCANALFATAVTVNFIEYFVADNFYISQGNDGLVLNGGIVQFITRFNINRVTGFGIQIVGGGDQYISTGVMSNVGFIQAVAGILIQASGGVWLEELDIICMGSGIFLQPGNGQSVDWLFAVNVACDSGSASGINIQPTGTGQVLGCDFTACWSSSASAFGVFLGGTGTINGTRFNGLRCQNNQQHGIVFNAGTAVTNTNISNCDISGNGAPVSPWSSTTQYSIGNLVTLAGTTYQAVASSLNQTPPNVTFWQVFIPVAWEGIQVGAAVGAFTIAGNRIGAESGYAVTQFVGIVVAPGASDNYVIQGNDVRGNTNSGILDSGTGTNKIIKDNLGFNPLGSVAITVTASPFSFANNTGGPIAVMVSGGTVSAITVKTQATGETAGQFIVPQGASITVTYTVAPTMVYFGL